MNETLVSWFEELIPEIKKSGSVKDTMLKFANDKNLAPALLEKLGHVYNTAKTVTYLDKCASERKKRAETFNVLDVSEMLDDYTKSANESAKYSDSDFSSLDSGRFTDLFKKELNFDDLNNLENADDYQEVKLASQQISDWKKESIGLANSENAEQLIFDLTEDNRKIASEISDYVRDSHNEVSFTDMERDAKYYFGDCVKQACDYVADYMEGIKFSVKRASDAGKRRLIQDTTFLQKFATIQNNLNLKEQAEVYKKEAIVQIPPHVLQQQKKPKKKQKKSPPVKNNPAAAKAKKEKELKEDRGQVTDWVEAQPSPTVDAPRPGGDTPFGDFLNEGGDKAKAVAGYAKETLTDIAKGIPSVGNLSNSLGSAGRTAEDFLKLLSPGRQSDQELIDRELDEANYSALIQDLIMTDPILSEEDEDKVVDLYNTIKSVAPELSKDKNVVRVVLRGGVQYDGIAAPDLAQLVEAERNLQKSKWNQNVLDADNYDKEVKDRRSVS